MIGIFILISSCAYGFIIFMNRKKEDPMEIYSNVNRGKGAVYTSKCTAYKTINVDHC